MIARRWLMVIALGAGVLAGGIYWSATQRADVVVAARDVEMPRPLGRDDLEVRTVSSDLLPPDAVAHVEQLLGLVPRAPLARGQVILSGSVTSELASFGSGLSVPSGMRAVALPVGAVSAVGGAVEPGARVDVLAVPALGRAPAGRTTELLLTGALVLDVRGESGNALVARIAKTPAAIAPDRISAVVIAISPVDELRFADRIATSTFVLALVPTR